MGSAGRICPMNFVNAAAQKFVSSGENVVGIEEYGDGIIHDTYLVRLDQLGKKFILQRLNVTVFAEPGKIMHNLKMVVRHIQDRRKLLGPQIEAGWQVLQLLSTTEAGDFYVDAAGHYWRAFGFISGARPLRNISGPESAREAGRAIGTFHLLTCDLDPDLLQETLPGFHDMEHYLRRYDRTAGRKKYGKAEEEFCRSFIQQRRDWSLVLARARRAKKLGRRVIHGDPKTSNIMVDSCSGKAVSVIDLDTVMPGLVLYDIGDSLRSCCNMIGEDAEYPREVSFSLQRFKAFLAGYVEAAGQLLTANDFEFLYDAVRLVPLELGLRFYTDFLAGNKYFKVKDGEQNLKRTVIQFRLVQSIERQEKELRSQIGRWRDRVLQ